MVEAKVAVSIVALTVLLGATGMKPAVSPSSVGDSTRLVLAPEGNEARYMVREQLARLSFPSDAVGMTKDLTGALVIDEHGKVVPSESRFTVDVTTLKSDRERRDRYLQRRTLHTSEFPTVELNLTELPGLPVPLPASGAFDFELVGDLTVHGVTRSTRWKVVAEAEGAGFSGTASTSFTFGDFGLAKPRIAMLLSVADTIRLEYDFHLIPDQKAEP